MVKAGESRGRKRKDNLRKENLRTLNQIDREIDVENTKGAIIGSILFVSFIFAMILYWMFAGY